MALVHQTIPGLFGGVSQQASELRHDTQVEEMINCYPSIVGGTQKRPPSQFIYGAGPLQVQDQIPTDSYIYSYDRGTGDEKYLVVVKDGSYRVFDLVFNQWANDWTADAYLDSLSVAPLKTQYALSTVGDTTFVVNKYKVPTMLDTVSDNDDPNYEKNFYYWVSRTNGDATDNASLRYTYYIRSDDPNYSGTASDFNNQGDLTDLTASFPATLAGLTITNITQNWSAPIVSSTSTTILTDSNSKTWNIGDEYEISIAVTTHDSNEAARQLASLINQVSDPNYSATAIGSVLKVVQSNGYKLYGSDSWGNQASSSWQGRVKKLQDLPNEFGYENAVIEISGDEDTAFDNYYVKYIDGAYKETYKPNLQNTIDASTMPHKLEIRRLTSTPTYYINFAPIEWNDRSVGDENSASEPSFIGNPIQDVFFYRNRLGFIANDNVVLSESGEYYNFFPTTVTSVIDSDVVDVAVDSNQAITLRYALPYNKELLLFADKAQFVMSATETLTPSNVSVQQSTAFASANVEPVGLGPNVYFTINKDKSTSIREYFVQPDSLSNDAANITSHCPTYIPAGVTKLVGSSQNDMLIALNPNTPNTLYVYNFYWNGEEKAQSAWHKWVFSGVDNIYDIQIVEGNLYLFTVRGDNSMIEKINLEPISDISNIRYEDAPSLDGAGEPIEGTGVIIQSEITLTEPGFATSNTKVDDKRGKFIIKNVQLNVSYGSFYNLEVYKYLIPRTYGYSTEGGIFPSKDLLPSQTLIPKVVSYTMKTDHKYPVSGKADKLSIKINNELIVGFKINTLDFFGNFVTNARSV